MERSGGPATPVASSGHLRYVLIDHGRPSRFVSVELVSPLGRGAPLRGRFRCLVRFNGIARIGSKMRLRRGLKSFRKGNRRKILQRAESIDEATYTSSNEVQLPGDVF